MSPKDLGHKTHIHKNKEKNWHCFWRDQQWPQRLAATVIQCWQVRLIPSLTKSNYCNTAIRFSLCIISTTFFLTFVKLFFAISLRPLLWWMILHKLLYSCANQLANYIVNLILTSCNSMCDKGFQHCRHMQSMNQSINIHF